MTQLQSLLVTALAERPDALALRSADQNITFAELNHFVWQVAAGLRAAGIEKGNRVAWLLPNSLEAVAVTLACYQLGAVAVPLNYRYVSDDVLEIGERIDATLIVFQGDRLEVVSPLLETKPDIMAVVVGPTS